MNLSDELKARSPSKWDVCISCYEVHETKEFLIKCPSCGSESEMEEYSTEEKAKEAQQKKILRKKEIDTRPADDIPWFTGSNKEWEELTKPGELLTQARAEYFQQKIMEGDQKAAEWLIQSRHVKTIDKRIYAYNKETGHYQKEGEDLLKADLVKAFGTKANRTRVGEILARAEALSHHTFDELEKTIPPNLIPTQNGIYDLNTNMLLPHSQEYFFTYVHPVKYDPNATCPAISKFLNDVVSTEREREILLDIVALCLYRGRLTRHFFILVGKGHNGKSKFLIIVKSLLGKNRVVSITPQALEEDVFAGSQIHDKHANLGADIPGGVLRALAFIKSVTGGDGVSVQRKGVDREEREPYAELIWGSNDPPKIQEDTFAIWDRVVVVNFPYTFSMTPTLPHEKLADMNIEAKTTMPEELSGLFNLAITRLQNLRQKKSLSVTINPEATRKEYRTLSDTPAVFVDEACEEVDYMPRDGVVPASGYTTMESLYRAYKWWCKENKVSPVTANKFGRAMESMQFERGRDNEVKTYRGIVLKQPFVPIVPISPILPVCKDKEENSISESVQMVQSVIPKYDRLRAWFDRQLIRPVPIDEVAKAWPEWEHLKEIGELYEPKSGFLDVL